MSLSSTSLRPSGPAALRALLLTLNLALLVALGGVAHGLFWGALPDVLPRVAPVARALNPAPPAPEFAGLQALVAQALDAPLPEPEPALPPEPEAAAAPLAGWQVVALLEPADGRSTAILAGGGRQLAVQAGDRFLDGEVLAIRVEDDGRVRVEVSRGALTAHLEQRLGPP